MTEWWTYRLGSFLMFSPRTYARLVEQSNADVWPLQPLAVALGVAALALAWRANAAEQGRIVWALLAGAWLWVGWNFLQQRFAPINWAAAYVAWAWGAQGVALAWVGAVRGRLGWRLQAGPAPGAARLARASGAVVVAFTVLAWPLVGWAPGSSFARSEVIAVMPDPTALATLGFLLMAQRPPWWLFAVPALSCALGGALSGALQAPLAWLAPALAVFALACAWQCRRARRATAVP